MADPVTISVPLEELRALVRAARECAEDLQAEIDTKYPEDQRAEQPTSNRRWLRDGAVATELLASVIRFETIFC